MKWVLVVPACLFALLVGASPGRAQHQLESGGATEQGGAQLQAAPVSLEAVPCPGMAVTGPPAPRQTAGAATAAPGASAQGQEAGQGQMSRGMAGGSCMGQGAMGQGMMGMGAAMAEGCRSRMAATHRGTMHGLMHQAMGGQTDPASIGMHEAMGAGNMDTKTMGRMLQMRGEILQAIGEIMQRHGKAMEEEK